MQVNILEFLKETGVNEAFYPGKRVVKQCHLPGDHKSHSVVYDWRDPAKIRVDVKAGLTGRDLEHKILRQYPVSLQSPTFVEIDVVNDNAKSRQDEDEDEDSEGRASGSGGGKGLKKKKTLSDMNGIMAKAFADISEGKVPELGDVTKMVVMGMEIAKEAFASVMQIFVHQIEHSKIAPTDLLAKAGKFITRYTPPAFMQPKGDEDKTYKYDRMKNENIGMRGPSM